MRTAVLASAICISIVGLSAAGEAGAVMRKHTSIAAQGLGPALQMFAEDRELQVVYRTEVIGDLRTAGAIGELTPDEALTQLLTGTGLTYRYLDEQTVTIVRVTDVSSVGGEQSATKSLWRGIRLAQAEPNPTAAAIEGSEIEEVVVSAQKRQERLIDVPQSVSVVSTEDLSKLGASQFRDFANTVPGLRFTTSGAGTTQLSMRGVTTGSDVNQTVAIYVDEIPYGSSTSFGRSGRYSPDGALFDLERVEVLRGPQGTLYGASSMGGLLKYVSNAPDLNETSGHIRTAVSSTREGDIGYSGSATINAPLVADKIGLRVNGYYTHDGGFIDSPNLGREDVNSADLYGGRADLMIEATEALNVRIVAEAQNISRDGTGEVDYTAATGGQPLVGSLAQLREISEPFDQRFRLVAGTVSYDFGGAMLTSISSYQETRTSNRFDISPQLVPLFAAAGFGTYRGIGLSDLPSTDKFTQEVRLASQGRQTIEWIIGGYYTDESSERESELTVLDPSGQAVPNNFYTLSAPSNYEEYAAFGDVTWRLTDRLDVTGGVRYAHNRQSYTQDGSGLLIGSLPTALSSEGVLTYLSNVRYQFSDHATGYVRYATGYRPGGPNFVARDPVTGALLAPPTFDADRLESYEVGYKAETSDRIFGFDVSLFYIDWSDIQVYDTSSPLGGLANQGRATIRGGEITLTARPLDDLTLSGNASYHDARRANADTDPEYTATVNADYVFEALPLRPSVGGTVRHVSDRGASLSSTTPQDLPAYTMVDLRTGMTFGAVDAQLYVRNLFDSDGKLSLHTASGRPVFSILQPRTIGISLSSSF